MRQEGAEQREARWRLARLDQRLLLLVEVVEAAAVLRAAVVALAVPLRRVVRLPEPADRGVVV